MACSANQIAFRNFFLDPLEWKIADHHGQVFDFLPSDVIKVHCEPVEEVFAVSARVLGFQLANVCLVL
jgi:hypothetical protein